MLNSPAKVGCLSRPLWREGKLLRSGSDCRFRIEDFGLQIEDCGLRIADYGLRIVDCGLQISD